MLSDLPFTLPALARAYADGIAPADVIAEVYRRIEAVNDPAIFISFRDRAAVVAEAEALGTQDPSKPLWGVPFVVKDNIDVAGMETTAACPAYAYRAAQDAFVVARLREAGALLIGKTNLDQFATGLVGARSPYGVPRNAIDPAMVPGGSSSGSAVAVAHGFVGFSLGTDTAGSGRVPAALNNIVGLKPTLGAMSCRGVVPACRTIDTVSIFALTVADAYAAYAVAAAFDPEDAFSKDVAVPPMAAPAAGLRIGVPSQDSLQFGDEDQREMFAAAGRGLAQSGAEIVPIDFAPFYAVAEMLYDGAWIAERHAVVEPLLREQPDALHPVTRKVIAAAESLSATQAFRGIYRLRELARVAEQAMAGLDALCVPSIPAFCLLAELEADPIGANSRLGTYTNFVNLLDMCGIAVPTAARGDGRPGSVTLLARAGEDGLCAALAARLHSDAPRIGATLYAPPPAPGAMPTLRDDEIEMVVCGAHMSGLPLNHELTSRGARLIEQTLTAPHYGFYALSGGPPFRPGLLRGGQGRAIEVEVWSMPKSAVGDFIAGIPSPLTIGQVELDDGRFAHGFLVEASGIAGAEDISDHGGWRAFIAAATSPSKSAGAAV